MNKRILDGAALWKSDKIARITPEWMRAEYANWIPLALANGVFEADTRRLWATVYSYNRPEITFDDAEEIKREFCRVGLLFFWPDEATGKVWGFFVGIDKAGRLPPESRVKKKHVETGPNPPADALRHYVELTRAKPLEASLVTQWLANGCLGSGSGSGRGKGKTLSEPPAPSVRSTALPVAPGFERFYAAYPRKKGKPKAEIAWRKVVKPEEAEAIIARVEILKLSEWLGKDLQYIPFPATWLNERRWEDEIEKGGESGKPTATDLALRAARDLGLDRQVN